ncbi:VirK/YbjX family protein [Atlantibacter hermannii]|uniref:VirK/YbjX family protein n=1 Tax=Atlantibacter hermannii TaxID=565 RepID=UPI0028A7995B|nr:VirK/YbjX family protein [Atlantibacter hermannii]
MSTFFATANDIPYAPRNGWQLFRALSAGKFMPGTAWQDRRYRRKFLLRSLATPLATGQLLSMLARQPHLDMLFQAQPGLPCRLHRPYLTVGTTRSEACAALDFHYKQLHRLLPAALLQSHWTSQGASLAWLTGKNGEQYRIKLASLATLDKEGETTLLFCDESDTVLAGMTFTLREHEGKPTLFIGGLQGAKSWIPHESIQTATKACHGLFPKRLLLEAACLLAPWVEAEQIQAVSNNTHIYRNWRYAKKKQALLHADYDSFWASMNGVPGERGYFTLPLTVARKPMEEIASKKRAEYRRRYDLLDSLAGQINEAMQAR